MREQLLQAREARQALIDRACASLRPADGAAGPPGGAVVFASTTVPGAEKHPQGLSPVFDAACERLASQIEAVLLDRGVDALGPWAIFRTARDPGDSKRACVRIEEQHRGGRLVDLDVYAGGRQVDRAALGLAPRRCLLCDRPAVECIRQQRHEPAELVAAVGALLGGRAASASDASGARAASSRQAATRATERLSACLVAGARIELALTPKPGLVDRDDNGSHPDLSFQLMSRSIDLLPLYFDELLEAAGDGAGLTARDPGAGSDTVAACVLAGRRAEQRMLDEIGANAHRGYIFLGGLTLLASLGGEEHLRAGIRHLARAVSEIRRPAPGEAASHGSVVRQQIGLGGIEREARDGLPSVFDHALPGLRARRSARDTRRGADTDEPLHYAMAILMQTVEDTTTAHRGGARALQRLRGDGRQLQQSIESGLPYLSWLRELNASYRRSNLTMGGVADCLALTVALDRWLE